MSNAGNVVVTILSKDKTAAGFKKVESRMQKTQAAFQRFSAVNTAAVAGLGFAVNKAVTEFAAYDKSIREIGTLLGNVTEGGLRAMGQEVQDLSIEFGQSIESMAKARY